MFGGLNLFSIDYCACVFRMEAVMGIYSVKR